MPKDSSTNFNKRRSHVIVTLMFILSILAGNLAIFIYQHYNRSEFLIYINDVDRLPDGNTLVRVGEFQTTLKIMGGKERKNCFSTIMELDELGNIVWQYIPEDPATIHPDHEVKKKAMKGTIGYFFTDCLADKIRFLERDTKEITWEYWFGDIDWQQLNSSWDEDHYYNKPETSDWSHVNDIDFKNYGTWESMLISIRDFNLMIEVNFTRAQDRTKANYSDIVWWYGGDNVLKCPHNPEYLPDGNILIVDSEHYSLIEVNRTTKEIEWEWENSEIMSWPRDCDIMGNPNRYLVTDVDEVFILNKTSGEVELRIPHGGYEADYIDSTNTILIGGDTNGKIWEFNADTGVKVWEWGKGGGPVILARVNLSILAIFEVYWVLVIFSQNKPKKWLKILPLVALIAIELFVIFDFQIVHDFFFTRAIC
ncbi:MAG: hypothetical protein GF364_09310 [Candidatus Lokiarchaeota archaeon]|nr:hypothetical protein [Candidatus Lokiarchaeota archaeon]